MLWIKHDTDANQDAKMQNVLLDYGIEGYGLYWYCLELIAGKVNKDNITFELEHDARIIARNIGSTVQKVEEMMRYFVKSGLFESSHGVITCLKIAKRLDQSMTSNPQMREIIDNFKRHDGVMMESCQSHDGVMQDKIRLDKIRLDKSRIDKRDARVTAKAVNYSVLQMNDIDLSELKRIRKQNNGKAITQRVANELAKQFSLASEAGYSIDEVFTEWETRGWKSFKSEWLKPKSDNSGLSALAKKNIKNTEGGW
jgi:hypothetical protein